MAKGLRYFTVLVGDLKQSRQIRDRRRIAARIERSLLSISEEFRDSLYVPLGLIRGMDEISGVLRGLKDSFKICRLLNEDIYPMQFRFAIVKGKIDIGLSLKDGRKMDGPAFHLAAQTAQLAKEKDLFYTFRMGKSLDEFDPWLTEMANISHILANEWSSRQRAIVLLYKKTARQESVAKKLGISQQAVSDALRQAHWREYQSAINLIDNFMERHT